MLLTADIGNTNIVLALLDHGDRVVSQRRIPSGEVLPPAAYEDAVRQALAGHDAPEGAVIGSVVPRLTEETARAIRSVTGLEALVVGPTTPAGLEIAIEEPETLGVDLLAACWSAWRRSWGSPVLPWPPAAWPGSSPPIAAGTSAGTTVCCCGGWR